MLLAKNPVDRPASAKDVILMIQDIERSWVAGAKTTTLRTAASRLKPGERCDD